MKRFAFLSLFAVMAIAVYAQASIAVFVADDGPTNVRNKPSGDIAMQLPTDGSMCLLLEKPTNGWWKVVDVWDAENEDNPSANLHGSTTGEYWVHHSVIGVGSRNYGGEKLVLREKPNAKAKAVYSFTEEILLRPIDIKGSWVKVKAPNGKIGWIQDEWLCDNPLTNCC